MQKRAFLSQLSAIALSCALFTIVSCKSRQAENHEELAGRTSRPESVMAKNSQTRTDNVLPGDRQQRKSVLLKQRDSTFQTYFIDIKRNKGIADAIKLSDIADTVDYIPLDMKNNLLIDRIQDLHVSDSLIIIRDKGATYLLDPGGHFIKSLYNIGKGPGEAYGTHTLIDEGNIYVSNRWSKKVMQFSDKGELLNEKRYRQFNWQFYFLNDLVVLPDDIQPADYSFFVHNRNTDSVVYRHPFKYGYLPLSLGGYSNMYVTFDIFRDELLFKEQVCDTIFSTRDFNELRMAYILDFGSKRLRPEDYFSENPFKFTNKEFIVAFRERGSFLLMKGVDNNELCQYLFNKNSRQIIKTFKMEIINDIDKGPPLHFWEMHNTSYSPDVLYFFINPYELFAETSKPATNSKLDRIKRSVSINSNPILVKAYLK